ncbi:MAG TPA: methyltransferase domain-containing protein, partial [Pyrinomonadaceae bacterium]|nr:methyltransferase domain-containing protein [Pyrinomonadaceae bacterium]
LAAAKVGPAGRAIGIDMTPEMIELAQRNAAKANDGKGYSNVEFHLATIDKLPLPDNSVDCVISNCVINLASDKPAVFREIARVLKPGGRLAVSDIALKQSLPQEISQDLYAYVGCISGAVLIDDYRRQLIEAGFTNVQVIDSAADLNAYAKIENQSGCCAPAPAQIQTQAGSCAPAPAESAAQAAAACCAPAPTSEADTKLFEQFTNLLSLYNVNDYAASVKVFAIK